MISWNRIRSILYEEYFISRRSLEIFFDIPFFSTTGLLLAGYISTFISSSIGQIGASYLIVGMILWECLRVTQYSISVNSLWEIWSRNLSNIFVTPITIYDYFIALAIATFIKLVLVFSLLSLEAALVFKFNILNIGILNLSLILVNLLIFGWTIGLIIMGLIFRFSTRIQSLAWGIIFILQPFLAALYPVSILPKSIQTFAFLLPPTYVFETARQVLSTSVFNWQYVQTAFLLNIVYLSLSLILFFYLFKKSKDSGQFARNEG